MKSTMARWLVFSVALAAAAACPFGNLKECFVQGCRQVAVLDEDLFRHCYENCESKCYVEPRRLQDQEPGENNLASQCLTSQVVALGDNMETCCSKVSQLQKDMIQVKAFMKGQGGTITDESSSEDSQDTGNLPETPGEGKYFKLPPGTNPLECAKQGGAIIFDHDDCGAAADYLNLACKQKKSDGKCNALDHPNNVYIQGCWINTGGHLWQSDKDARNRESEGTLSPICKGEVKLPEPDTPSAKCEGSRVYEKLAFGKSPLACAEMGGQIIYDHDECGKAADLLKVKCATAHKKTDGTCIAKDHPSNTYIQGCWVNTGGYLWQSDEDQKNKGAVANLAPICRICDETPVQDENDYFELPAGTNPQVCIEKGGSIIYDHDECGRASDYLKLDCNNVHTVEGKCNAKDHPTNTYIAGCWINALGYLWQSDKHSGNRDSAPGLRPICKGKGRR